MYSLVVSRCATSFIAKVYSTDGCKQNYVLCLLVETEKKKKSFIILCECPLIIIYHVVDINSQLCNMSEGHECESVHCEVQCLCKLLRVICLGLPVMPLLLVN